MLIKYPAKAGWGSTSAWKMPCANSYPDKLEKQSEGSLKDGVHGW